MDELMSLAKEKGFKAKTFSTGWTMDKFFGGKDVLVTDKCILLLMHEIQSWLREEFKIIVWIQPSAIDPEKTFYPKVDYKKGASPLLGYEFSFPKALESALLAGIKLI